METKRKSAKVAVSLLALVGLAVFSLFAVGGSLEPSAPPGPTMKTLDEVEARIPIPGSSSPTGTFVVSFAGSYYLTGDRYANDDGIRVDVDNVTIDLNGYNLIGSGINNGVYMRMKNNVEIRNGTVRNFDRGIYESDTSGQNHRVINVRSLFNELDGIHLKGSNHLVKNCTVRDNGTSASSNVYGIYVGFGSTVTGNTAHSNGTSATGSAAYGIKADEGSTVTGNTAHSNGTSATGSVYGIYVSPGSTVTDNTVYYNGNLATGSVYGIATGYGSTVTGNSCYRNEDDGIFTGDGSTVTGNTCHDNGGDGIRAGNGSTVIGNTCYDNVDDGIYTGGGCTVTGNTCRDNGDDGIHASTGCTVTGNTSYSNVGIGIYAAGYCLVDQNAAYNNGTNMVAGGGCVLGVNCAP